ncbi:MAG: UbiA family prenyltransferase [Euryarchaeota archaeon]|nr:UbiA family prenyltransferase [Euryarchaeota archaeon]
MASSIYTSIDGVLMLYLSFTILEVPPKPILLCAMFFVIYSVYSLNKVTDQEEDAVNMPERSALVQGNEKILLILAVVAYIMALFLGWLASPFASLILLVPIVLGIAYSKDILSIIGIPRLKDILFVKSFVVALSWATCVALLPSLYLESLAKLWFIFPFFFIKVFINTVLFDVRDVTGDAMNGVTTVPVVIGVSWTKRLLLTLQSLLALWTVLFLTLFNDYSLVLIASMIYGYLYILYFCTENNRNKILWDMLVDGEWIVTGIGLWVYVGVCLV